MLIVGEWGYLGRGACLVPACSGNDGGSATVSRDARCYAPLPAGYDNDQQYWIIKNSWGPRFGQGGYAKVAYGATKTSIGSPEDT